VLHFFIALSRAFRKSLVCSEEEVGDVDLVPALLLEDDLIVVEHFDAEVLHHILGVEISPILEQTHINAGRRVVVRRDEDFFFEDDAILLWVVLVRVLNRLAANHFSQLKGL